MEKDKLRDILSAYPLPEYSREFTENVIKNIDGSNILKVWSLVTMILLWITAIAFTVFNIADITAGIKDVLASLSEVRMPRLTSLIPYTVLLLIIALSCIATVDYENTTE